MPDDFLKRLAAYRANIPPWQKSFEDYFQPTPDVVNLDKQFEDWDKRATEHQKRVETGPQQLTDISQAIESYGATLKAPTKPGERPITMSVSPFWEMLPPFLRNLFEIGSFVDLPDQTRRELRQQLATTELELEKDIFYADLYSGVPINIMAGDVTSIDDLVLPPSITDTEREGIADTINEMVVALTQAPPLPEMAPEAERVELPELITPTDTVAIPVNISDLTQAEIMKSLKTPVAPPSVMTEEEWSEFMVESGQISDKADLESIEFLKSESKRLIDARTERDNQLAAYREGIAEMSDYQLVDMLKELVVTPGLGLLQAANIYFEHVSMPLAGAVYKTFIPDIDAEYQRLRKTEGTWEALGNAWEEWDSPGEGAAEWILKYMLMEGLVDPLTYVGWGIATRITKPLGGFGRLVGAAERGIAYTFEIPFDLMKAGIRRLPRTPAQLATISLHKAGQYVDKAMTTRFGKAVYQMTMKEWDTGAKSFIKYTLKHPQWDNDITRAGKEFLKHRPVTEKEVLDWSSRLSSTLTPDQITKHTIDSVDSVFEDFFRKIGGSKKLITNREAGDELVRTLFGKQTDDVSLIAGKILLERSQQIINSALSFSTRKTPFQAIRALMKRNYAIHIDADKSAAFLARREMGSVAGIMSDIPDTIQRVWNNSIDRFIVRPFAESYLTFAMYGPMNVIEDIVRSSLGGVKPGRKAPEAFARKWAGVSYDPEIMRDAVSETLGYLNTRPQGELNNWILQLGGLAKGFGDKTYGALVVKPGQVGSSMRRNFLDGRASQILKEMGGDQYLRLANVVPNFAGTANKKLNREIQQFATDLAVQGNPTGLRIGKADFTRTRIIRREVDKLLQEHPDLPRSVRDFVMRQYDDGVMFNQGGTSINRMSREADNIILDDFIASPEHAATQFDQLSDMLTQLEIRNPEEMAKLIQSLNLMSSVYGATPKQILARAAERTRGLPFAERRLSMDKALDSITLFRERAGASMDKLVERIKVQMHGQVELGHISPSVQKGWTRGTDMPIYDQLISNPKYYATEKGMQGRLMEVSPDEALQMGADVHGVSIQEELRIINKDVVAEYATKMGAGDEFPIPVVDYITKNQEGRHRLLAARELGREKVPVLVVDKPMPLMDPNYITKAEHLFNLQTTKRLRATELGEGINSWRHGWFAEADPGLQRTEGFWDDFYRELDGKYRGYNLEMADFDGRIKAAIDDLDVAGGIKPRQRPPIKVTTTELSPQDVALMIGARGDDVSRGIMDVLTAQNDRDMFTSYVMAHVRPDDVGFTPEAIGRVHDQIANSLHVPPEKMSWVAGKRLELDGVRNDLHALYNSKMLPDDEVANIGRYLDDSANAVQDMMYAPPVGKKPPALKEEFTNYNELRQSAMDEAHKWYYKEFTDYSNANAFDAFLKAIYPFWTYESIGEDGQILTRKGWKYHNELEVGEDVLAMNPKTLTSEWVPLEHINVYDFDGDALHMYDKEADFIFTKEHNWLVINPIHRTGYFEDEVKFVKSTELVKRHKIPRKVPHVADWDSILSPHDAAVLGWIVTDGYKEKNQYLICQSKQVGKDDIVDLLSVDGEVKFRDYSEYNGYYKYVVPKPCQERIEGVYSDKGDLIDIVTNLSVEAAQAMMESMLLGDGDGVNHFYQRPGPVMDAFQILCILTGKYGNISTRTREHSNFDSQAITVCEAENRHATNIYPIHYKGKMWCPTTKHGTFLMRRNGKVIWTGNSQRWFWLPRSFVRHPGTFTAFERWQDNTDYGYIHVPGTSVDIGFGRGTVYGTLQTRLTRRDYPEYYDSLPMGDLVEFNDFLTRFGFYPGAHVGIPLSIFGGAEMRFGEVTPSIVKTPLDLLIAAFPDNKTVTWISERIFGDGFRNYMTMLQVSRRGGNGSLIYSKKQEGIPLTPEEEALWTSARQEMGLYSAGFEQFGIFRMRTDEQNELYRKASELIEELYGYTPDQQDWLRKHGYRIWDLVGGLTDQEQAMLQELDYYRFSGNIRSVLPGKQQEVMNKIELGWNSVERYNDSMLIKQLELQQEFLSGARGPDDYNLQIKEIAGNKQAYILTQMEDLLTEQVPEGMTGLEREEWIETHSLMTLEGRADYMVKYNIVTPVLSQLKELRNLYFSIKLQETTDPETGEIVLDWDNFWAQRQAIEQSIPEQYKAEWEDFLMRNSTRMEQARRDVYYNYFKVYNKVWEKILTRYSEEEQALINEYLHLERTGTNIQRQEEIKAIISPVNDRALVSGFRSDVSGAKQALRYANPTLDAWLYYWGKTSTFVSPTGQDVYIQLAKSTGRSIQ